MALAVVPFWSVLPEPLVNVVVDSLGVGTAALVLVASGEAIRYPVSLVRSDDVCLVCRAGSGVFGHVRESSGQTGTEASLRPHFCGFSGCACEPAPKCPPKCRGQCYLPERTLGIAFARGMSCTVPSLDVSRDGDRWEGRNRPWSCDTHLQP